MTEQDKTEVTGQMMLDALREVVAEFGPEHAAPVVALPSGRVGCRYVVDEQPSCIAAQVCVKLGIANLDILKRWDAAGYEGMGAGISLGLRGKVADAAPLRPTEEQATRYLVAAQSMQDEVAYDSAPQLGTSWGLVLHAVEDEAIV